MQTHRTELNPQPHDHKVFLQTNSVTLHIFLALWHIRASRAQNEDRNLVPSSKMSLCLILLVPRFSLSGLPSAPHPHPPPLAAKRAAAVYKGVMFPSISSASRRAPSPAATHFYYNSIVPLVLIKYFL